jgi:hypothetical protein
MGLGCVLLIVGSATLQVTGLGLVAWELWRVQHQELGPPRWMQWVRVRWRLLRGRPPEVHARGLSSLFSIESAVRGKVRKGAPADATLEQRVIALESNLAAMDTETEKRLAELDQRLTKAHQRADEAHAYADQLRQQHAQERREELRQTMPWQWVGTGLFAVGALLAMWASLAC